MDSGDAWAYCDSYTTVYFLLLRNLSIETTAWLNRVYRNRGVGFLQHTPSQGPEQGHLYRR